MAGDPTLGTSPNPLGREKGILGPFMQDWAPVGCEEE